MSALVCGLIWKHGPEDPVDMSVLLYLGNCGKDDGESIFPGIKDIAVKTRRSERTVKRCLEVLHKAGWIDVVERGVGRGKRTHYVLNIQRLHDREHAAYKPGQPTLFGKGDSLSNVDSVPEKVTATTIKGDSLSEPPDPHKGVNVIKRKVTIVRFSSDEIESIYWAYPRHVKPEPAKKAILKALESIESDDPVGDLLAIVKEYAESKAGNQGQHTPHPATWFNAKQYLDDPKEWDK